MDTTSQQVLALLNKALEDSPEQLDAHLDSLTLDQYNVVSRAFQAILYALLPPGTDPAETKLDEAILIATEWAKTTSTEDDDEVLQRALTFLKNER